MIRARSIEDLRSSLARLRGPDVSVGLVPTMGALHEGHLSLIHQARADCDVVVLSIFVNPLQFGPGEDLGSYPRREARDLKLARDAGVDVAFLPTTAEMYPEGFVTSVKVGELGDKLEGAARPGHFDGVATVVVKLFNIAEPERAYFGQKDAQQVAVIRKLVEDLSFALELVVCDTVRAPDGLALSSRNAYLSDDEHRHATALWRALKAGEDALQEATFLKGADERRSRIEKRMTEVLEGESGVEMEYARVVDPDTFEPSLLDGRLLLVVAARVGAARLIDNLPLSVMESTSERLHFVAGN